MSKRINELDSIRGLAAITVVFGHFCLMLPSLPNSIKFSPLRFLWAGGEAVIVFYVLSGFVLSMALYHSKTNYWGYLIKRFVRIYIPYYFWIFITFALFILFSPYEVTGLRDWFYDKWQGPITNLDIMNHFVLLNNFFTDNYNPVIWSLAQEMRISIVFPLLFLLFYKLSWKKTILFAMSFSLIGIVLNMLHIGKAEGFYNGYADTLHFTSMFMVGMLLFKHQEELTQLYRSMKNLNRKLLIALGVFLYLYSIMIYGLSSNATTFLLKDWGVVIGVSIIIIMAMNNLKVKAILNRGVFVYLGEISYSIYLCHFPITMVLFKLLYAKIPTLFLLILCITATILCSILSYHLIEKKCINWAKQRTAKFKKKCDICRGTETIQRITRFEKPSNSGGCFSLNCYIKLCT
ncbi:acyltransferase [Bacillus thuringiensis]|uniref:Acyltransferase n=3 Tax=Bacillus thuringiensis TaxID=1428 RepID=A0AB35PI98_BACTU|nr:MULTISPECIES: acyltransferase [Bacillus]EAO57021.1 O-acetyl transferase [Bacillus thuringiensis serovar israelensis ATCC 35646]MED1158287.1 acyltransferase [Bacillus paranthracis]AJH03362.1 acyltransferase family protein [Bacillus thuringiensis HD1002]APF32670.1 acyltransferase [Bacillus thuringiensis serovar israelensis]EEM98618.1 O-acetyl transferase [Bacillus thuringiensis IBL 4222]